MDFITESDLEKIQAYAGQEPTDAKYAELRAIYDKLGFLCDKLKDKGYETDIIRDPRKRAGQGAFKFQDYQWAKVYPPGFRQYCNKEFAYIVGLVETLHFHMKGIGDFEHNPASLEATDRCWTDLDLAATSSYEKVVEEFIAFDKQYRPLFIDTALELGIHELLPLKNKIMMDEILGLLRQEKQIILQGPPGTGKTRLAEELATKLTSPENIELIQFHPAYSYEDFVRGITVRSNGPQLEYKTENRVLATLAQRAQENLRDSQKPRQELSKEKWVLDELKLFAGSVLDVIDEQGTYPLTEFVSLVGVDDDAFRYTGRNWAEHNVQRMKFPDIILAYINNAQNRQDIIATPGMTGRAQQHASYDFMVLQKFREYLQQRAPYKKGELSIEEQAFVLIIDEINRANLPAVLGELIYALEYRGKTVKGIYELDGDKDLVIPNNLYVIGTMNTADRSIGHIDYAIKRRFPAVDIVPSAAVIEEVVPSESGLREKAKNLFLQVAEFFSPENLAPGFKAKQVQIGHSYFLSKTEEELRMKLEYSIKPLLREYLKDGILRPERGANGNDLVEAKIDNLNL